MNIAPAETWHDGDTLLNNSEDRAGALLIAIFAAIVALYIVPELLKHLREN